MSQTHKKLHVGLFATCLVDWFRPQVGFAAVKLLQDAGCEVSVPESQTCCGQPAYNNGDYRNSRRLARQLIEIFTPYDYVIVPSGSCAATLRVHYPRLLQRDSVWRERAENLAARTYELLSFLVDVLGVDQFDTTQATSVTYHDACSGLRELGIKSQARRLLNQVKNLQLQEMPNAETCCGFGGTFCVKYPEISQTLLDNKIADITTSGADVVTAGDLGCLLHIAGRLQRLKKNTRVYHIAEILAGMSDKPGIAEPEH